MTYALLVRSDVGRKWKVLVMAEDRKPIYQARDFLNAPDNTLVVKCDDVDETVAYMNHCIMNGNHPGSRAIH